MPGAEKAFHQFIAILYIKSEKYKKYNQQRKLENEQKVVQRK